MLIVDNLELVVYTEFGSCGWIKTLWLRAYPTTIFLLCRKNPQKPSSARADGLGKKIGGAGAMRRKRGQPLSKFV